MVCVLSKNFGYFPWNEAISSRHVINFLTGRLLHPRRMLISSVALTGTPLRLATVMLDHSSVRSATARLLRVRSAARSGSRGQHCAPQQASERRGVGFLLRIFIKLVSNLLLMKYLVVWVLNIPHASVMYMDILDIVPYQKRYLWNAVDRYQLNKYMS